MSRRGTSYIKAGRVRIRESAGRYDLTQSECTELAEQARVSTESAYTAICSAFYMGVEAGARLTERRVKNGKGYAIRRTI